MIVYGERLLAGAGGAQAARALLNLASRLGLSGRDGAGLLEAPSSTNARGLREAGFAPGHGPGFATLAERRHGRARASPAALASAELSTVWLHHADPLRAFPDRAAWEAALGTAQAVIAVDSVLTDTIREHADVVFPAEAYAEKEGTLTHPDGRVQRLRPAIGRPKGPDQQSGSGVRPLWQVIADVAERTGLELGVRTGPMASQQLFDAVPFYAGLTLDAIGGRGIRWPASEAAAALRGRAVGARQARGARTPCRRRRRARCAWAPSARCGAPRRSTSRRRCASCARARSSSSRPSTRSGSGSATATRSRSAPTGRASRAPSSCAPPCRAARSSSPPGTHEQPANVLTEPMVEVRRVGARGRRRAERRRRACRARRRGPVRDAGVRAPRTRRASRDARSPSSATTSRGGSSCSRAC